LWKRTFSEHCDLIRLTDDQSMLLESCSSGTLVLGKNSYVGGCDAFLNGVEDVFAQVWDLLKEKPAPSTFKQYAEMVEEINTIVSSNLGGEHGIQQMVTAVKEELGRAEKHYMKAGNTTSMNNAQQSPQ